MKLFELQSQIFSKYELIHSKLKHRVSQQMQSSNSSFLTHSIIQTRTIGNTKTNHKRKSLSRCVSSQSKFQSIFSRNLSTEKTDKKNQKHQQKNNNLTYINLGNDEQCIMQQTQKFKSRMIFKQNQQNIQTERKTKAKQVQRKSYQNPQQKRTHHKSFSNYQQRFTFIQPYGQKKNLIKFQKKLLNTLQKRNDSRNNLRNNVNQTLKNFSCSEKHVQKGLKLNFTIKKDKLSDLIKINNKKEQNCKMRFQQIDNLQQKIDIQNQLLQKNQVDNDKRRLKLIKQHFKHNTASQFSEFLSVNNNKTILGTPTSKRNQNQHGNKKLLSYKYQKNLALNDKFKFKKINIKNQYPIQVRDETGQLCQKNNNENKLHKRHAGSEAKLKYVKKCRNSCSSVQKQAVFTPWEYIPSEKEIQ